MIALTFFGCNRKEGLDLKFRTIYTSQAGASKSAFKTSQATSTDHYTQFGDFLGTITPYKVTAKFNTIRFIDRKNTEKGMQTMLEIIGVNWPFDDERRFADFTNGNEIEVIPEIYGNVSNDGWFVDKNIKLKYLLILPQEFILEFKVPDQLTDNLTSYRDVYFEKEQTNVRCGINFLLYHLNYEGLAIGNGIGLNGFVFGETDTSYIVYQNHIPADDVPELITQAQPNCVVRSADYVSPVLTPPSQGKTKIITTRISFNSQDIIQHYAGQDNTPNTWDDIFVFVPKFWEGFNVEIDQN